MERISVGEAEKYIQCKDDCYNTPASFYTIENEGEWDKVTYYTHRLKEIFKGKVDDEWVYVLSNPSMPGILKIGYTKYDPYYRANQLNKATGVPEKFIVEWAYNCYKGEKIENETHKYFKKHRVNNEREFFRVSLDEVKQVVTQIGSKYI